MTLCRAFRSTLLPLALAVLSAPVCLATEEKKDPPGEAPPRVGRGDRDGGGGRERGRGARRGRRGGFRGRRVDKAGLLRIEKVREDLGVTDKQNEEIREALASLRGDERRAGGGRRRRSEEDEAARAKRVAEQAARQAAVDTALSAILSETQMKRLNGILLQQRGLQGLTDPSTVAALKLSEKQVGAIQGVIESSGEKTREAFQDAQGDRQGLREAMQKIQGGALADAIAQLTGDQKKLYEALKGEPLEIQFRRGGARRGRAGGEREGGRRGNRGRRPPADDA
jgi:hypothetical protein